MASVRLESAVADVFRSYSFLSRAESFDGTGPHEETAPAASGAAHESSADASAAATMQALETHTMSTEHDVDLGSEQTEGLVETLRSSLSSLTEEEARGVEDLYAHVCTHEASLLRDLATTLGESLQSLAADKDAAANPAAVVGEDEREVLKRKHADCIVGLHEAMRKRRKSGSLPSSATEVLKDWFFGAVSSGRDPYPTEEEKANLCAKTGLTRTQLQNWLINARKRTWQRPRGRAR